ncbi:hypothetical protein L596_001449 [Steinernema carpocapsae]|uniref:Uncharacterized protein n=1 Tax=Steinernema carpocapsae TaxID=34508 RepID=A0A4U8UL42_STECR|nr:hypothetical protein L596_001449 [Steinernema carpocapsae]
MRKIDKAGKSCHKKAWHEKLRNQCFKNSRATYPNPVNKRTLLGLKLDKLRETSKDQSMANYGTRLGIIPD